MKNKMIGLLALAALAAVGCTCLLAGDTNSTSSLPPLEKLMPKFEVRSNAPTSFQVAFLAYNTTNWTVVTNILPSRAAAEATIEHTKFELRIKYAIGKQLSDALPKNRKSR